MKKKTFSSGPEHLNIGLFPNVPIQYHWNALTERALNKDKPIIPVNDTFLQKYLEPPENLKVKAMPSLAELDKLFPNCDYKKESDKKSKVPPNAEKVIEKKDTEPELKNSIIKESPSIDEGFFSREDVDVKMEEVRCMIFLFFFK